MTARRDRIWATALLGAAVVALMPALLAYRTSPLVAAIAIPAIAGLALIFWKPVAGICVAMLLVPFDLSQLKVAGSLQFSPTEITVMVTAIAAAAHLVLGRQRPRLAVAHFTFFGVVAICATGLFFAADTSVVIRITGFWLAAGIVSVHIAASPARDVERALMALVLSCGIVGLVAILGAGPQEVVRGGEVIEGRSSGTFNHPNVLTFFLTLGMAPAIALAARGAPPRRVLMLACAVLSAAGIMLAIARGGIVGAAVSLLVLMLWRPFRRTALLALFVMAVAFALNLQGVRETQRAKVVTARFATLTSGEVTEANARFDIWRRTPTIIADHPLFGVGAGNYPVASRGYGLLDVGGVEYDHAHDLLLTVAAELGLVGLALFLAFLWGVARAAAGALRDRASEHFPLALACIAALVGLFVTGIGEFILRTNSIIAAVMIEVGALVAFSRVRNEPEPAEPELVAGAGPGRPASAGRLPA